MNFLSHPILYFSFKKITYLLVLLPVLVFSQSTDQNYIKTVTYKDSTVASIPNPSPSQALVNVTYMDGLGRPIQQVLVQRSSIGQNIVTPITYDSFGRQDKDYLPVPMSSTSLDYTDNLNVISDPTGYYTNTFGSDGVYRYAEKRLESSALNRVLEQGAPGKDWRLGNGHTIQMEYQTNTATEVKLYKAVATYNPVTLLYDVVLSQPSPNYPAQSLYKSIVKDENWTSGNLNTTEEFKNKEGQVVLKRTYNPIDERVKAHDTYYVYDQFGNLSFVIPPLADHPSNTTILNNLCYQYKYDKYNRLAEKKLPGKDWEFIVYDKLDRVVATGPVYAPFEDFISANRKGCMITKYDVFNRVVLTGWKDITSRISLQTLYNNATVFNEVKTTTPTTMNSVGFKYSNTVEPKIDYHVLTVNYYDDYDYTGAPSSYIVTLDGINQAFYNNTTQKPKGLPTGSWVRVLENSTDVKAEISYTLYDKKARPVKSYSTNHFGGFISSDIKLDFAGKTLYTITRHKKEASSNLIQVREDFTYSNQDHLLTHTHKVNGNPTELLAKNKYNDLGQLINKNVGGTDLSGAMPFQKVDYTYNIRGWLKSINDIANLHIDTTADLFAFKINYNEVDFHVQGVEALFNGNIAETYWITDSDNDIRGYGYQYDNLNRLLAGNYHKNFIETHSYDENLTYDKNGNIITLLRNGYLDSDSSGMTYQIDQLDYTYKPNSNQLQGVLDHTSSNDGFKDVNPSAEDFIYDVFGNMIQDRNKGITNILYNHLNLPIKIKFRYDETNQINYLYNAVGVKVGKKVRITAPPNNTVENQTDYLSGFQYKDNVLEFFPTAEGYVSVTNGNKFNYVYNYTDHLGNIRLSYSLDPSDQVVKIMEENHYYPFGLKHINYNVTRIQFAHDETGVYAVLRPVERGKYQYKYNGKEFQDELSLNWYDYHARNYDAALGRWMNIDPLAEKSRRFSPYTYALNNPVFFIDPDGMMAIPGPGDEFATLAEAANDFGNGYFGYSQENMREIGTNFYQTATGKFSYAEPVMGLAGEVDVSQATEGIPTDAVIVGDGHTHPFVVGGQEVVRPLDGTINPNPIGSKEASTLKLENFTTDGGPTNTKKYQIENGSNAPSADDKDKFQNDAKTNSNFIASYVYTGSGLVYSAKKDNTGNVKTQVQGTLSKTSPSTPKSSIRINTNPASTIPPTIPKEAISR